MTKDRGIKFNEKLWEIESESSWEPEDLNAPEGPYLVFFRYLESILQELKKDFSEVASVYAAISGIEPGIFKPIAAVGRELNGIAPSRRFNPDSLVANLLYDDESKKVVSDTHPQANHFFKGRKSVSSILLIKLIGYGELFGYVFLDTEETGGFSENILEEISTIQPALSRVLAGSVFSMRLWGVAITFEEHGGNQSLEELYRDIVKRTLIAFAACGVILRIYDKDMKHLPATEFEGPNLDEKVMEFLLEEHSIGEEITEKVFNDPEHSWTVGMLEHNKDPFFAGTSISLETENKLRQIGIIAYCVFRLESEVDSFSNNKKLGTLSFFYRHKRRFSWRDIALAKSLSQRAADLIALYMQTQQLKETTTELKKAHESLLMESQMMTRVEIVTLLAHDLGHKALRVKSYFENFCNDVKKVIRDGRPFNSLTKSLSETEESINALTMGLHNVNQLFYQRDNTLPVKDHFLLKATIDEVFSTLSDALNRNNCEKNIDIPENLKIYGHRHILLQVIFNLIINTIEAQRSRKNPRKNTIHIQSSYEKISDEASLVYLKFWDEGPGINRNVFPDANQIFELGKTTKPEGTGRGLPISRNLLNTYFGADMILRDPSSALFIIEFKQVKSNK